MSQPSDLDTLADSESSVEQLVVGRGTLVGRYVVLGRVGRGAMGVVYAAYDPELDRKVALKLLGSTGIAGTDASSGRARLLREAQAMARLAHPNVVAVYDAGTFRDLVFVAMELVDGTTLATWQATPRPWREIVAMYVAAGRGLAAAHAAGLVHRDFKPENVMVGSDGRARVMDFGLARGEHHDTIASDGSVVARFEQRVAMELTREGALVGTPAYMAPEQWLDHATDARTDQFALCVALWEALYGKRPFTADNVHDLALRVTEGAPDPPPPRSSVPRRIALALSRGLSRDPADRFPDVGALLDALAVAPTRRRAGVVLGSLALAAAAIVALADRDDARCDDAAVQLAGTWDEDRRGHARASMLATGVPFADASWIAVERTLDTYATDYMDVFARACRGESGLAPDLRGPQSVCLARRRRDLRALVDLLATADATVVERANDAAASLARNDLCDDTAYLAAEVEPPADAIAADVERLRGELAHADASRRAGKFADALAQAQGAMPRVGELGYLPLSGEAHVALGNSFDGVGRFHEAEHELVAGFGELLEAGDNEGAARAAIDLGEIVGSRLARFGEGRAWINTHAVALARRAGIADELEPTRLGVLAGILREQGELAAAHDHAVRSLALVESAAGASELEHASAIARVGTSLFSLGRYDEARDRYERAIAIVEAQLGPDHPRVADIVDNLGNVLFASGDHTGGRATYERALAARERVLGPDHPDIATSLDHLANVLQAQGELQEARSLRERGLRIREATSGPDDPSVADALGNLGTTLHLLDDYQGMKHATERALAIRERALGPDHPDVADSLTNLSAVTTALGDYERARALNFRAVAIYEKRFGPDHPKIATAVDNVGILYDIENQFAAGRPYHERAIAIREKALGPDHPAVAELVSNLGQSLVELHEFDAARTHLERALAIYEASYGPDHASVGAVHGRLGLLALDSGQLDRAWASYSRALAIEEKTLGPDHSDLAYTLVGLGQVATEQGRVADAVPLLERAVALRARPDHAPVEVAAARFELARALWQLGRDRARARDLAAEARAAAVAAGPAGARKLEQIDAWLARDGRRKTPR